MSKWHSRSGSSITWNIALCEILSFSKKWPCVVKHSTFLSAHTSSSIFWVPSFYWEIFHTCEHFSCQTPKESHVHNRPFAQLLPGLETGHPVTVSQSPAYESHSEQSETETRKTAFCCRKHWNHMQVTDRPSPDAPSLTQAIIVQMVYCLRYEPLNRSFLLSSPEKFLFYPKQVWIFQLREFRYLS